MNVTFCELLPRLLLNDYSAKLLTTKAWSTNFLAYFNPENIHSMDSTIKVSKLDAALAQLNSAVTLYFKGGHTCAVHTLAAASLDLTNGLIKGTENEKLNVINRVYSKFNEPTRKKIMQFIKRPQNYLKHADRDPQKELEFDKQLTEILLLSAALPLQAASLKKGKLTTVDVQLFILWCSLKMSKDSIIYNSKEIRLVLSSLGLDIKVPDIITEVEFYNIITLIVNNPANTFIEPLLQAILHDEEFTQILNELADIENKQPAI